MNKPQRGTKSVGLDAKQAIALVAGLGVATLVSGPVLALVPAALLDRGPSGGLRTSLLWLALVAWDPFVWSCLWHSLVMAVIVACGSWLIGVALARMTVCWRFWGRGTFTALALGSLAIVPAFGALGLRELLARGGPWPLQEAQGWLAWLWVALAAGVPVVALATRAGLSRIEPAWEDAARLAGASHRRIWWMVDWPLVRYETARAVAAVFTFTLLEPGAPLVLGLRRTLAYQVVEAALSGPQRAPRAAALVLLALVVVGVGRLLVRWWGRAHWPAPPVADVVHRPRARWYRAGLYLAVLAGWSLFSLVPGAAVVALAILPRAAGTAGSPGTAIDALAPEAAAFFPLAGDVELHRLLERSLGLGALVGVLGLALAWVIAAPAGPRRARFRAPRWLSAAGRTLSGLTEAVPPLAIATGALMLPGLLSAGADFWLANQPEQSRGLHRLAAQVDPYAAPGLLLVVALLAVHLPALVRAAELGLERAEPALGEAARSLGASRKRAWRSLAGVWLGSTPLAALAITIALAATNIAPALLLAPTSQSESLGAGFLYLSAEPGEGVHRAACLATAGLALNAAAFALASRRRAGALGAWFRG